MAAPGKVGGSEYSTQSWHSSIDYHPYATREAILAPGLIRPRTFVDIRERGGMTRTYFVTDDPYVLWDTTHGGAMKEVHIDQLLWRNIAIAPAPNSKVTSIQAIGGHTSRSAVRSIRKLTTFANKRNFEEGYIKTTLTNEDFTEITKNLEHMKSKESKDLRSALSYADNIRNRAVMAVDFETEVVKDAFRKASDITSSGVVVGIDRRFRMPLGGPGATPGLSEFGYRTYQATEYFDLKAVQQWLKGGTVVENVQAKPEVGKAQIYSFYDTVTDIHNKRIQAKINIENQKLSSISMVDTGGAVLPSVGGPDSNDIKKTIKELNNQKAMLSKGVNAANFGDVVARTSTTANEILASAERAINDENKTIYSVGEVIQNSYVGAGQQMRAGEDLLQISMKKNIYIAKNVALETARSILMHKQQTGANVAMYSDMEAKMLRVAETELTTMIDTATRDKSYSERAVDMLRNERSTFRKAREALVDMKVVTQNLLDMRMKQVKYSTTRSSNLVSEVLRSAGLPEHIAEGVRDNLSTDLLEARLKGTSLENARAILAGRDLGATLHNAPADSRDLIELVLRHTEDLEDPTKVHKWLPLEDADLDPKTRDPSIRQGKGYFYSLEKGSMDRFQVSEVAAKRFHSRQAAALIMERANIEQVQKLLGNLGKFEQGAGGITSIKPDGGKYKFKGGNITSQLERALSEGIYERSSKMQSSIDAEVGEQIASGKRLRSVGLASTIASKGLVRRMLALKVIQWADSALLPGETHDHGTHASLETVARRAMTTDFGSGWISGLAKYTFGRGSTGVLGNPASAKLLRKIGDWSNRRANQLYDYATKGGHTLVSNWDTFIENTRRVDLDPAMVSAKRRILRKGLETEELMENSGAVMTNLTEKGLRDATGKDLIIGNIRPAIKDLEVQKARKALSNYNRQEPYSHFGLKSKLTNATGNTRVPIENTHSYIPVTLDGSVSLTDGIPENMVGEFLQGGHTFSSGAKPSSLLMNYRSGLHVSDGKYSIKLQALETTTPRRTWLAKQSNAEASRKLTEALDNVKDKILANVGKGSLPTFGNVEFLKVYKHKIDASKQEVINMWKPSPLKKELMAEMQQEARTARELESLVSHVRSVDYGWTMNPGAPMPKLPKGFKVESIPSRSIQEEIRLGKQAHYIADRQNIHTAYMEGPYIKEVSQALDRGNPIPEKMKMPQIPGLRSAKGNMWNSGAGNTVGKIHERENIQRSPLLARARLKAKLPFISGSLGPPKGYATLPVGVQTPLHGRESKFIHHTYPTGTMDSTRHIVDSMIQHPIEMAKSRYPGTNRSGDATKMINDAIKSLDIAGSFG